MKILKQKPSRLQTREELNKIVKSTKKNDNILDVSSTVIIQDRSGFIYENKESDFFFPKKKKYLIQRKSLNNFKSFSEKPINLIKKIRFFHLMYFYKLKKIPIIPITNLIYWVSPYLLNKKQKNKKFLNKKLFLNDYFLFGVCGKIVKLHTKDLLNPEFRLIRSKKILVFSKLKKQHKLLAFFNMKDKNTLDLSRQIILKYI